MKKINIGIIGTGRMAQTMLHAMRFQKELNVRSVFGHSEDRVKQFARVNNIPNAHNKIEDLLNDVEIEAVYIASENKYHADQTIQALAAGKSVLCEKPIATSTKEIAEIQKQATESNCLCMEGMWTHFLPAFINLFEANKDNHLGVASALYADFGYPTSEEAYPKLFSPTTGGGVLFDRGVYPIALSIKLFGHVDRIQSEVTYNQVGADTRANILLTHASGTHSQLTVSLDTLLQNRAVVSFTKGSISLEPPILGSEIVSYQQMDPIQPSVINNRLSMKQKLKNAPLLRKLKAKLPNKNKRYISYGQNQYLPMLDHFCRLVNQGDTESDIVPLSLSHEVMRVIEEIKKG